MIVLAYLCVILKSVIYGSSIFFTGQLTASVDVMDVLALRFLMSFAVLWLLKVTRIVKIDVGVFDIFRQNSRSQFMRSLLLAALFEPVLYMLFETVGISMSSDITTAVILSLAPISSCIVETAVLKEKNTGWQKFFLAVGIAGVVYIAVNTNTSGGSDSVAGIVFLVLAVVSGSLFAAFSRRSSRAFSSMERTYITAALGMVAFNLINVVRHLVRGDIVHYFDPYFNLDNMVGFVFLAVISTIVATGMNNYALSKLQITTLSAFGGVSTLTTIAIGVLIGKESLQPFHLIGLVLILTRMVGVSIIAIKKGSGQTGAPQKLAAEAAEDEFNDSASKEIKTH